VSKETNALTKGMLDAISKRWGHRAKCFRVNVVNRGHVKSVEDGTPDILGAIWYGLKACGQAVGIEVKGPGDKQSAKQIAWQIDWEMAGGIYLICEDVSRCMAELERRL
jgi:hypothetical protein